MRTIQLVGLDTLIDCCPTLNDALNALNALTRAAGLQGPMP
ncbi:hypothetical protein [Streptomyces spiralis]